jgi:hypothetical protein
MIIFVYVWVAMVLLMLLVHFFGMVVEKYVSEEHSLKKWWRKHIVGNDIED